MTDIEKCILYHTQEKRDKRLSAPIKCIRHDAWLGHGYYFWLDEYDADKWGRDSKTKTGCYEIYTTSAKTSNILDVAFDVEHYNFWEQSLIKAAKDFKAKNGFAPDKSFICNFIMKDAKWNAKVDGILFDDRPNQYDELIKGVPFRKRLQFVLYNLKPMGQFKFYKENKCQTKKA